MSSYAGAELGAFGGLGGIITFEWAPPGPNVMAAKLMELAGYLDNVQAPLRAARAIAIADMEAHFDSESAPDGAAWTPLDPDYAVKRGSEHPILQLTGAMHDAAVSPAAYPVDGNSLFFTTGGLPFYWQWHQEGTGSGEHVGSHAEHRSRVAALAGTGVPSGGMHESLGIGRGQALPARPFVGLSQEAELQIIEVFDMWFDAGVSIVVGVSGVVQSRGEGGRFGSRIFPNVGALSGA